MEAENSTFGNQPLNDLKETIKRRKEILLIALAILFMNGFVKAISGLVFSTYLITALGLIILALLVTNAKGYVKLTKAGFILSLCAFLLSLAFVEGLRASAHFYLIPLVIALPAIVENNRQNSKEIIVYFVVVTCCFCLCLFLCEERSQYQQISEDLYYILGTVNNALVIILSTTFSFLNVHNERKYARALSDEKNKAVDSGSAKTKFLLSMAHELRTPLNGIIGATSILKSQETLKAQGEYFKILDYCSHHMLHLVNDILDFNKIEAGKLQLNPLSSNLSSLLEQCYVTFNNRFEEKRIQLRFSVDKGLNTNIMVDDVRLIQVLNNLLSNAWKFTDQGCVEVSANVVKRTKNHLTAEFIVRDTGIGIDESAINRIFEGFWQVYHESTRKYSGTGLGLSISQNILQLMGSSLHVESQVNKGTTFSFTVRFRTAVTEEITPEQASAGSDLSGLRILIAEDNPINMLIAKKMLQDRHGVVTTSTNGAEALELLAANNHYDLILLDLEMPVMDGYTAVKEIAKSYPGIPVIAFTASVLDKDMIDHLKQIGFTDFILKPVTAAELERKIKKNVANTLIC